MYSINGTPSASLCDYYGQSSYPKMISWNKTSSDCCTWEGVKCHQTTGHVISLDLSCSGLSGFIHHNSTLFHLSHLIKLNLAYNDFFLSPISGFENIGRLSSLTHLNLSTSIFGVTPLQLSYLSKLVLLDISGTSLKVNLGDLEILLQNLTFIKVLSLQDVQISASNSPANFSLSSLTYLNLGSTGIDGKKISNFIFHLPLLETLILTRNDDLSFGHDDMQKSNCLVKGVPNFVCSFASLKKLDLSYCSLSSSSIAKSIGNLSQIIQFYFEGNNSPANSLPAFIISNLPKLRELDLGYNSFTGQFPSFLGNLTELTFLSLEGNFLRGPLPSNISGLKKLRDLSLSYNKFDGTIPAWLFSIPSLMDLSLQDNCFTGGIKEFASSSIETIDFGDNKLNGSIEFSIFSHLKSLLELDISNNKLSLKVGNEANVSFANLSSLALYSCRITKFPNFLKNTKKLRSLDLSNNRLHGEIPEGILQDNLFFLNLSHNSLSKSLNINLASMKNLQLLDLSSNQFQEPLPLSICNLQQLVILDLSNNNFSGSIPECFGNIGNRLLVMKLAKNDLTGLISLITFPKDSCQLLNLDMNGNSLGGSLPRSLINCKSLEILDLGSNKINDSFPTNLLEHLVELKVLILKSNRFSRSIRISENKSFLPKLLLIDLSWNEFSGALPSKLFKSFKAMISLNKVEPNATGYMGISALRGFPYTYSVSFVLKGQFFELVKVMSTFVFIDLSCNNFTGGIPEIIGDLNLLIALNFSHNSFSGHIPSTLGRLHFLESLDLSCNQIEGEIPWQLADIIYLEFLNLSKNHLKGCIPQGRQFHTFLNDSYYGNSELCGFPVTKDCGAINWPLPHSRGSYGDDEDSSFLSAFTWKSVLIGYGFGILLGCLVIFTRKPKWLARNVEELCLSAFLLLGKRKMCKQFMKKSRRFDGNRHRR